MSEPVGIPAGVTDAYPRLRTWAALRPMADRAVEPDDLVQDALLRFWTSGAAARCPTTAEALRYIGRSITNRAFEVNRRWARHPDEPLDEWLLVGGPAVEDQALARADLARVLAGLGDDPHQWLETTLLAVLGYDEGEIGAALGVLPASVRPRIHKWRRREGVRYEAGVA